MISGGIVFHLDCDSPFQILGHRVVGWWRADVGAAIYGHLRALFFRKWRDNHAIVDGEAFGHANLGKLHL